MFILVFIIAALLRLISINQSLWLDEAINLNAAHSSSFKTLIFDYSLGDFHPPLYHVLLKLWITLCGMSEISARVPSVILALGTIFFTYHIAKILYDKKTALISSILLATAPLHIYYSQEARMYMLAGFLSALSVYFFVSLLARERLILWIGFIISTTFLLYTDYLPYLMLPAYGLFLLSNRKKFKSQLVSFIPSVLIILTLLIPWMILFPKQLHVGLSAKAASPAWTQVVGNGDFKNLILAFVKFTIGRITYSQKIIYALLFAPAAIFVTGLFAMSTFRMSTRRSFIYFWFFLPIIFAFIISYFVPVFSYFRFIFVLPAFYIIWASAISSLNWIPLTRILLTLALILNLSSSLVYLTNPKFQREDWRGATAYVAANSDAKTVALFESESTISPFEYYNQNKVENVGALTSFSADPEKFKPKLETAIKEKNKVYLFQYLSGITDPEGLVYQELTKHGFANTQTKDFNGVGFIYEFVK